MKGLTFAAVKFGVIIFPGSNCDEDMVHVLRDIFGVPTERLWHKEADLKGCDHIVLPGGFSYGDYLRSGAIARFSPIMEKVIDHAKRGGMVLGICNGFQVLCEAGLLPGVLLHNVQQRFVCRNVHIRAETTDSPITRNLRTGEPLTIPIAHAEGNYFAHAETLDHLEENDQVLFRYCDQAGELSGASDPNGSKRYIAGICNQERNVVGMMPHPERASSEVLGNTEGSPLFGSLLGKALGV